MGLSGLVLRARKKPGRSGRFCDSSAESSKIAGEGAGKGKGWIGEWLVTLVAAQFHVVECEPSLRLHRLLMALCDGGLQYVFGGSDLRRFRAIKG